MVTKKLISEVMSELGKRNLGKPKRRTVKGWEQRYSAAQKSAEARRGKPRALRHDGALPAAPPSGNAKPHAPLLEKALAQSHSDK